jgi:hypothetical protein
LITTLIKVQNSDIPYWAIRHYKHDEDRIPLICCLEFFQTRTLTPWPRLGSHTNSIDLTVVSVWWYSNVIKSSRALRGVGSCRYEPEASP